MNLTTAETEELRLLFATGEACSLRGEEIEEVSLGAAIELACMRVSQVENVEVRNLLDAWAANLPVLGAAFDTMIRQSMPRRVDIFGVRIFEFFPIAAAWDDNDHHLFEARFDAGLRNAGFGKYSTEIFRGF